MIKIGMMIGDRYEILERIGTGGMSDVYKAKDHKLNRYVAIKILKQEFSENANFVSKFRTEAQAAAGLMHPNIVNIYDVGEEEGTHYIVMELVEGITLKKYIEKKARLSVKEAVSIAIQVAMGIEAAHNHHIIHRDIKPQNIMISKEGKVKVTDFGIAKAATSNTITSNVMGSVHYTSPEQARGGYSDEKSDIYSMGITLYEMLTGRVPFNGETTVAIAIKHIQEELPSPRDYYVPEIPISVEKIVFKCCQKSPDRRYQTAGELIEDLKQSLLNPDDDFVKDIDTDKKASTRTLTKKEMERIKRVNAEKEFPPYRQDEKDDEYEEYDEDFDPKMEKITTLLAVVSAVIICCIVIFLVGNALGLLNFGKNKNSKAETATEEIPVEMIDVIGLSYDAAQKKLNQLGLKVEKKYMESSAYEAGVVISSDIQEGAVIDVGTSIVLTVSSGMEGIEVPQTIGKSYEEAKKVLEEAGLSVNKTESASSEVPSGYVISQRPEGKTNAPKGSSVALVVSTGAEDAKVAVPKLTGLLEEDALAVLVEAGLQLGSVTTGESADFPEDQIYEQSIAVGSYVEKGTAVDVKISTGAGAAEAVTYSYSGGIQGPTAEEDPNYKSGTEVSVMVVTADGTTLISTKTAAFPLSVNYSHIKSATGTLTLTYVNKTDPVTTTDPGTGETTVKEGTTENKTVTRTIQFTAEG